MEATVPRNKELPCASLLLNKRRPPIKPSNIPWQQNMRILTTASNCNVMTHAKSLRMPTRAPPSTCSRDCCMWGLFGSVLDGLRGISSWAALWLLLWGVSLLEGVPALPCEYVLTLFNKFCFHSCTLRLHRVFLPHVSWETPSQKQWEPWFVTNEAEDTETQWSGDSLGVTKCCEGCFLPSYHHYREDQLSITHSPIQLLVRVSHHPSKVKMPLSPRL